MPLFFFGDSLLLYVLNIRESPGFWAVIMLYIVYTIYTLLNACSVFNGKWKKCVFNTMTHCHNGCKAAYSEWNKCIVYTPTVWSNMKWICLFWCHLDASAAMQVRALKDYCNNYDLTSLNIKAGDIITVRRSNDCPKIQHIFHPLFWCCTSVYWTSFFSAVNMSFYSLCFLCQRMWFNGSYTNSS